MKKILNIIPDLPFVNDLIVYITSIVYYRSFKFYFGKTLNAYLLKTKTKSHSLSKFVDKIQAKEYISDRCGDDHVVKTLSYLDDQRKLPNCPRWVFKSNDDFRGALIYNRGILTDVKKTCFADPVVCRNNEEVVSALEKFISKKVYSPFRITREACYLGIQQRFFFEEVISSSDDGLIPVDEYKFHIIEGEVAFVYVVVDRMRRNQRVIVDAYGKQLDVTWCKSRDLYKFKNASIDKISNSFSQMKDIALKCSKGFRYVRVDLYDLPKPKVGELTFFHGSGLEPITPSEFDHYLGRKVYTNVV